MLYKKFFFCVYPFLVYFKYFYFALLWGTLVLISGEVIFISFLVVVRTDQLLLRKNYNVIKRSYVHQNKSFFVLLRLQVKSMLSLYFFFSKKRFFLSQSIQKFNCFNPMLHGNIFRGTVNRRFFYFSGQNKKLLFNYKQNTQDLSGTNPFSALLYTQHRTFRNFYSSQLFYAFLRQHRLFIVPTLGLASRFLRYSRFLKMHNSILVFNSVIRALTRVVGTSSRLRLRFLYRYRRFKSTQVNDKRVRDLFFKDFNRVVILLARNLRDKVWVNTRFLSLQEQLVLPAPVVRMTETKKSVEFC